MCAPTSKPGGTTTSNVEALTAWTPVTLALTSMGPSLIGSPAPGASRNPSVIGFPSVAAPCRCRPIVAAGRGEDNLAAVPARLDQPVRGGGRGQRQHGQQAGCQPE